MFKKNNLSITDQLIIIVFVYSTLVGCASSDWRTASRESANLAVKATEQKEPIFQIYIARAFSWRGYFATHPWISWKRSNDKEYSVAQVTSWAVARTGSSVTVEKDLPDRAWFGHAPELIFSVEGPIAEKIIQQVETLIATYRYRNTYTLWPGPNSNTFVEYIIRNVSELTVELPSHAIGKDYLVDSKVFAKSPSGNGVQVSIFGVLGFTLGLAEGIEVNILSLTFGIDFLRPALKLPFFGRLGVQDRPL